MEPRPAVAVETGEAERAAAKERIENEHRALSRLLARLEATQEVSALPALLAELHRLLLAHFATEEGPSGLHEAVGNASGTCLPAIQRLFAEHRDILAEVTALQAHVEEVLAGPVAQALAAGHGIADALRRHEADEDALFAQALYSDLGGG